METNDNDTGNDTHRGGRLVRNVEQAALGAHDTITSVSDAATPAVERIASGAHHIVDRVAGVASGAAQTLGVKGEQLKSAEKKLLEGVREYVNQHPVSALGIAIATGYLLTRLLSSK